MKRPRKGRLNASEKRKVEQLTDKPAAERAAECVRKEQKGETD